MARQDFKPGDVVNVAQGTPDAGKRRAVIVDRWFPRSSLDCWAVQYPDGTVVVATGSLLTLVAGE